MHGLKKRDGRMPVAASAGATAKDEPISAEADKEMKRLAALKAIFGLWANRADAPEDGVEFQRKMRAEWR